ncbi:MAG: hypothetical protein VYA69_08545 [Gemmatimonadota bacterium]|nr:hypothetical protein [Gemmatimonadota bacterium]
MFLSDPCELIIWAGPLLDPKASMEAAPRGTGLMAHVLKRDEGWVAERQAPVCHWQRAIHWILIGCPINHLTREDSRE